MILLETSNR